MGKKNIILALVMAACGSDSSSSGIDAPGGTGPDARLPDAARPSALTLSPSATDQATVQAALINVKVGQIIYFTEGTYHFSEELSLTVNNVTLAGMGDRDKIIFDFKGQTIGGNGIHVANANDLVIQGITVHDTGGSSIRVDNGTNVTFRNVKVEWTAGSASSNGGYALYPVQCTNVLIENCEIHGSSDAGIYVGQSSNIVVRNNKVSQNVAGIEIENSTGAEVYGNTSTDNVSGVLVFNLPSLVVKAGANTVVHDNMIVSNNHAPFAAGGVVSDVPSGTGMVILSADTTEVRGNTITGNKSTGIVVGACSTLAAVMNPPNPNYCNDSGYDIFPEGTYIHDNTFSGNGTSPQGFFQLFWADHDKPFQDIAWDGVTDPVKTATDTLGKLRLCIQGNGTVTFVKVDPVHIGDNLDFNLDPYNCSHPSLPAISVTWGNP